MLPDSAMRFHQLSIVPRAAIRGVVYEVVITCNYLNLFPLEHYLPHPFLFQVILDTQASVTQSNGGLCPTILYRLVDDEDMYVTPWGEPMEDL